MVGAFSLLGQAYSTATCTVNKPPVDCSQATASKAAVGVIMIVYLIILIPLLIITIASMWKLFTKAGKPGWAALIPIYNTVVLLQIVGRPLWWIILILIPFVNIVISFILVFDLAKAYGKDAGFGILMLFLPIIGYPMLAFGKSQYVGPLSGGVPAGVSATPYSPPSQPFQQQPVQQPVQPTIQPTQPAPSYAPTEPVAQPPNDIPPAPPQNPVV